MQTTTDLELSCIVDRVARTLSINEWNSVAVPAVHELATQTSVTISDQRMNYLVTDTENFDIALGYASRKLSHWHSPVNLRLLLARDAVNVVLRKQSSYFTTIPQRNTYLVGGNEIINALSLEQNASTITEEADIIDLFLVGFEESIDLTLPTLYVSTPYSQETLKRRLNILLKMRFIAESKKGHYALAHEDNYEKLEIRLERLRSRRYENVTPIQPEHQFRYLHPVKPQIDRPIAFVGLPFSLANHFSAIEAACSTNGFLAYKIDRDPRFDTFLNKVMGAVLASDVCIFDLTGFNANVMLELGVALTTFKDIIVVAEEKSYAEANEQWKATVSESLNSSDLAKLEQFLKDSKFVKLVPSDVRERPVHLFTDEKDLENKLTKALRTAGQL